MSLPRIFLTGFILGFLTATGVYLALVLRLGEQEDAVAEAGRVADRAWRE